MKQCSISNCVSNIVARGATNQNKSSGIRNVYPTRNGKWFVRIVKMGVPHYFGTYVHIEDAIEVAENARKELFGEFAGRG